APRAHYEGLYLAALSETANLHLRGGDPEQALPCLERLIAQDPLEEEVSRRLLRALGSLGQRAGIEREYRRLTAALRDELATSPLPETRRAYEDALDSASGRGGGARPAGGPPPAPGPRRARWRQDQ